MFCLGSRLRNITSHGRDVPWLAGSSGIFDQLREVVG